MGFVRLSPQTRMALRATFLSWYGARKWMSTKRKVIAYASTVLIVGVPTVLAAGIMMGRERSTQTVFWLLVAFFIGFYIHEVVLALELLAKKEYEDEMGAAGRVQQRLLPTDLPQSESISFASHFASARDVGGDYYDVISLGDDRYAVVVADVSGKGVPASLLMVTLRALLRDLLRRGIKLNAVAAQLNQALWQDTSPAEYATLFCGILDVRGKTLDYFNAGHVTPYLVSASGTLRRLDQGGPPVGLLSDPEFAQGTQALSSGDRLVVYTDGVSDVGAPEGSSLKPEELEQFVVDRRGDSPQALVEAILTRLRTLKTRGEWSDDITILVAGLEESTHSS